MQMTFGIELANVFVNGTESQHELQIKQELENVNQK